MKQPHKFYMDEHIADAIIQGLRTRGIEVLTAREDQHNGAPDSELLNRAAFLGYVIYTNDTDFLQLACERQQKQHHFGGVIYSQQQTLGYGQIIEELELIARCCSDEEIQNQVLFLPLR